MVLLENFGAAPFIVKPEWLICNNIVCSLPGTVTLTMMPGIPKFQKENHPERAKDRKNEFFTLSLRQWTFTTTLIASSIRSRKYLNAVGSSSRGKVWVCMSFALNRFCAMRAAAR